MRYRGPNHDPSLLLDKIIWPTPSLPDGTLADPIVDQFPLYDSHGRIKQKMDFSGVLTDYLYYEPTDGIMEGHLRKVVADSGGLSITSEYTYDDLGRLISFKSPPIVGAVDTHLTTTIMYNELDQIIEMVSPGPLNLRVKLLYDSNGNLERVEQDSKDEYGNNTDNSPEIQTYRYDSESRLIESTIVGVEFGSNLRTSIRYDNAGNKMLTLPNGNRVRTLYNELMLPVRQILGFNSESPAETNIEYDNDGRVTKVLSAKGNAILFSYDPFGHVISQENALGNIIRRSYDKRGNQTLVRVFELLENNSYVLISRNEFGYDSLSRLIHSGINKFDVPLSAYDIETDFVQSPGPGELLVDSLLYNTPTRVVELIDRASRIYQIEFDALHRITKQTDSLGNEIINHYDLHSNIVHRDIRDLARDPTTGIVMSERIFSNTRTYDELDRLITSMDSLGNQSRV